MRLRAIRGGLVVVALLIGGCQPDIEVPANPRPIPPSDNKLGLHTLLDDGRNHWPEESWPEYLDYAREAVGAGGTLVQLVEMDDLDTRKWQYFMDLCAERDLQPILRLATDFDDDAGQWVAPPSGPGDSYRRLARRYARFLSGLEWPTDAHLVTVGNEPNRGDEWGGMPDPAAYARFLIDVAAAVHEADPDARVLNGALDGFSPNTNGLPFANGVAYMDAESFMDGMHSAEPDVFRHIDGWASHSYPLGPFAEGPWQQEFVIHYLNGSANNLHISPPDGVYNRGVNGYEWELHKLASYGIEDLPVFITETGWRHQESTDPDSTDTGGALPDAETVGIYLELALYGNHGRYPDLPDSGWTPWLEDERVASVSFFALGGQPAEWGHTNWLILDEQGTIEGWYSFVNALTPP